MNPQNPPVLRMTGFCIQYSVLEAICNLLYFSMLLKQSCQAPLECWAAALKLCSAGQLSWACRAASSSLNPLVFWISKYQGQELNQGNGYIRLLFTTDRYHRLRGDRGYSPSLGHFHQDLSRFPIATRLTGQGAGRPFLAPTRSLGQ
jgi:hypothetical protein